MTIVYILMSLFTIAVVGVQGILYFGILLEILGPVCRWLWELIKGAP